MPKYVAHPTCQRFHQSPAWAKLLVGPFGSGKSVACVNHLLREMSMAAKSRDGIRYSKILVARNSYRELQDTTKATLEEWIPAPLRRFSASNMSYIVEFTIDAPLRDLLDPHGANPKQKHYMGIPLDEEIGHIMAEVLMRSLATPDDIKKLLSLEISGAWLNEAREFPRAVFDAVTGRLGRFPREESLQFPELKRSWAILDTNPCDQMHWLYRLFVEDPPEEYSYFHQPSGLSERAENIQFLPARYYERMSAGKTDEWVNIYVHGQFGFDVTGKAIHPQFLQQKHVAAYPLEYEQGVPVLFGCDYGLTPAAVIAQESASGQIRVLEEIVTEDMGADTFGELLSRRLRGKYNRSSAEGWGDPAGDQRSSIRESENVTLLLRAKGIPVVPAPTNDPMMRQDALNRLLTRNDMTGEPAIIVSPTCKYLVKGLSGGYQRKRLNVSGETERYSDKPDKNIYSHVCEALHYMLLGMGKGYQLIQKPPHLRQRGPVIRSLRVG